VRGHLGMMLFSGTDGEKRVGSLSGGEAARLVFSRLALEQPNVLVLDEPTNHLDLEAIEALVAGLQNYQGTLILVSHDRWFVRQLATRVVEISRDGIRDFVGSYEEYVFACGDDHLDANAVVLRARRDSQEDWKKDASSNGRPPGSGKGGRDGAGDPAAQRGELERRRDEITAEIEEAEAGVAEIDALFCRPGYYDRTPPDEVAAANARRDERQRRVGHLMAEWERLEIELETIG
jgi:energy-coupling factor transporter ATP-binding protein EcfA2